MGYCVCDRDRFYTLRVGGSLLAFSFTFTDANGRYDQGVMSALLTAGQVRTIAEPHGSGYLMLQSSSKKFFLR
jgi:hypothetical protein